MAADDATLTLCGPCRHFEQALFGAHACRLGLALLDGVERSSCAQLSPFPVGEGSQFEQSDCCRHAHEAGHRHADPV